MTEQNFEKCKQQDPLDLEKRLTTFYGPQLREQPLSQVSWQNLRLRLGSQEDTVQRHRLNRLLSRKSSRAYVPTSIQDTFTRISYEARVPSSPSMLHCSLKLNAREPAVRSSWFGRHKILLILSLNDLATMGQAELDILVATGLARSISARKLAYALGRFFLASMVLIASIVFILSWIRNEYLVGYPLSIALCAIVLWLLHRQAHSIAFHADSLMVLWLGRSHVCSGLHALADRSLKPRSRRWLEPSLAERIERVCGTRVETKDNQLTLVR